MTNRKGCPPGMKKIAGKCKPQTNGKEFTKTFKDTKQRNTFIDKYFPTRECKQTPGFYKIPNGYLQVFITQIWWKTKKDSLKSKNPDYDIIRNKLDFPEGHIGYSYDVLKNGKIFESNISKKSLDKLRKKHKF